MKLSVGDALIMSFAIAGVIFFCRIFPFLFFRNKENPTDNTKTSGNSFLAIVEKTVPPVAMTVLAFNALATSIQGNPRQSIAVLLAAGCTAAVHLWRRNPLMSIFGGTLIYMVLIRLI